MCHLRVAALVGVEQDHPHAVNRRVIKDEALGVHLVQRLDVALALVDELRRLGNVLVEARWRLVGERHEGQSAEQDQNDSRPDGAANHRVLAQTNHLHDVSPWSRKFCT